MTATCRAWRAEQDVPRGENVVVLHREDLVDDPDQRVERGFESTRITATNRSPVRSPPTSARCRPTVTHAGSLPVRLRACAEHSRWGVARAAPEGGRAPTRRARVRGPWRPPACPATPPHRHEASRRRQASIDRKPALPMWLPGQQAPDQRSRMRESCTSGSVGAPGRQLPGATRRTCLLTRSPRFRPLRLLCKEPRSPIRPPP